MDAPKGAYLMGHNEEGSLNIVTLLLTGRATPYLHNGVVYVGDEDHYVSLTEELLNKWQKIKKSLHCFRHLLFSNPFRSSMN